MPPAYEVLLLNTAIPQIQAAQSGDTYVVPRDIAINATAIISANSATDALRITQTGAGNALVVEDSSNPDSSPFVVSAAGDVGIGTSSPAYKFHVYGSGASGIGVFQHSAGAAMYIEGGATNGVLGTVGNNAISFAPNSTNRMLLDTSGNLGLGVAPSAWGTDYKAIQIGGSATGALSYKNFVTSLSQNVYSTNANDIALVSGSSAKYELNGSGQHVWKTAAVTAGNAITFTQAMTLDASGNLLVGTTNAANANAKIRSSSGIEYSNSVLFNVQNPNGKVFTVTGGSNGNSTFVEIEVLTYEGYFKAVYFCINSSGNWENDKYNEVTSGTPATVTVAGNNTATMTFTVACTTSFTPLMRVAMGNQYVSMA